jgi:hypothetical protein
MILGPFFVIGLVQFALLAIALAENQAYIVH